MYHYVEEGEDEHPHNESVTEKKLRQSLFDSGHVSGCFEAMMKFINNIQKLLIYKKMFTFLHNVSRAREEMKLLSTC